MRTRIEEKIIEAKLRFFTRATPRQKQFIRPHLEELQTYWWKRNKAWVITMSAVLLFYILMVVILSVQTSLFLLFLFIPPVIYCLLKNRPAEEFRYNFTSLEKKISEEAWVELLKRNNIVHSGYHNGSFYWDWDRENNYFSSSLYHKGAEVYSHSKTNRPVALKNDSTSWLVDQIASAKPTNRTNFDLLFADWTDFNRRWEATDRFGDSDSDSELRCLILSENLDRLVAGVEAQFSLESYFFLVDKNIPHTEWEQYAGYPLEWLEEVVKPTENTDISDEMEENT